MTPLAPGWIMGPEKLDGLETNTAYKITLDGVTYEVDSDDAGAFCSKARTNRAMPMILWANRLLLFKRAAGISRIARHRNWKWQTDRSRLRIPQPPHKTPDDIHIKDISTTLESITIAAKDGLEYSMDNGMTWLKPSGDPLEVQFSGLVKDTEYTVQTRYGATDSSFASQPSSGVKVKTKNMFEKTDFIISPYSKAYDGKAHSGDIEIPVGANVTFATELNGSYGTTKPEFTNTGDYVVYYCVEKENYYNAYGYRCQNRETAFDGYSKVRSDKNLRPARSGFRLQL